MPSPTYTVSSASSSISDTYPAPEAPIILPDDVDDNGRPSSSRAFLAHSPARNSTIEVRTYQNEYQLLVGLPGFSSDSITLATKKKRVLHVVADRWDNDGGGHFERRIAFGYDADLSQVKADFDRGVLRISIPRRAPSITSYPSTPRHAPMGRT
ncbi:hypothetical protein CVT24_003344 [Panaeolus cyanescens]|uniref:SHSP domain-containing protein n=1 Tax=Panaeolus cyanescens TaxID=181874 RepID=A0A409Y6X5_9AGAR|nr:hypothetical protein CVT24_003344 [Panaeolus cyanescens]